jgi:hypothetical protein
MFSKYERGGTKEGPANNGFRLDQRKLNLSFSGWFAIQYVMENYETTTVSVCQSMRYMSVHHPIYVNG